MADRRAICPTLFRQLINYNPETGEMTWRPRTLAWFAHMGEKAAERHAAWNATWPGRPALNYVGSVGYRRGKLFERDYQAHRVAFAFMTGRTPDMIDHVNHVRSDNRWANLRETDATGNARNTSSNRGSTSKYLGVFWDKRRSYWTAKFKHGGKVRLIGNFQSEREAAMAYDAAAVKVFGAFTNLNFPAEIVRNL